MQGAGIAFVFPVELHVVGEVDLIFFFVIILSSFIVFRMNRILNLVHSFRSLKLLLLGFSWLVLVLGSFKSPSVYTSQVRIYEIATSKVPIYKIGIRIHGGEVVFSPGAWNGFSPGAIDDAICLFDLFSM